MLSQLLRAGDPHSHLGVLLLASGIAASATATAGLIPNVALALIAGQPGGLDTSSATRAIYELTMISPIGFFLAGFLAAQGISLVRRVFAAPWLGWLSLALAIVNLVGGVVSFSTDSSSAGVVGLVGLAGFGVVVLASSIYLLRYRPAIAVPDSSMPMRP